MSTAPEPGPMNREASLAMVNLVGDDLDTLLLRLGDLVSGPSMGKVALTLTDVEREAIRTAAQQLRQASETLTGAFYPYVRTQ